MSKAKVWKIKGYEGVFTDEDLITLIRTGQVKEDFRITTKDIKEWIKVKDSIYEYYLKREQENETI